MATMYPKQVELNEQNLQKLVASLKKTHTQIVAEIKGATDFGVANRKQILAQIEKILEESGQDVQKWLEKEMPEYYKTGADHAVKQLDNIGAEVAVTKGFNKVHKETITALIDDSSRAFGESLSGVGRSANMILGKATREILTQEMAKGLTAGEALRTVKNQIVGMIEETGIGALIDKSGKTWQLDTYAEMLFRTKAVEARNRGLVNRVAENDYDLVQVSQHGGSCDACSAWEGKILSVTGKTKGYETVADAEADGLFHPNCRHAINVIIPKLASMTKAYDPDSEPINIQEIERKDTQGYLKSKYKNSSELLPEFARGKENLLAGERPDDVKNVHSFKKELLDETKDGDVVLFTHGTNKELELGELNLRTEKAFETYGNGMYMTADPSYSITEGSKYKYQIPLDHETIDKLFVATDFTDPQYYVMKKYGNNPESLIPTMKSLGYSNKQIDEAIEWTNDTYRETIEKGVKNARDYAMSGAHDEYEFSSALMDAGLKKSGYTGVIDGQKNLTIIDPRTIAKIYKDVESEIDETKAIIEAATQKEPTVMRVFRGEGKKGMEAIRGMDSYGKGKYYSLNKEYVGYFGDVTESTVKVENPLEIRSQEGLNKATQQMIQDGYEDMGSWAKSKGYDAIIDHETEIMLKLK